MMRAYGWTVVEYSNEGSESEADHVQIISDMERLLLCKRQSDTHFFDEDIHNTKLSDTFYNRVGVKLAEFTKPHDIVCHTFGPMQRLVPYAPKCFHVESGIGYSCHEGVMPYRIFESDIWRAWHAGRQHNIMGSNIQWVAPNYYDLDDWDFIEKPDDYILFFGRIKCDKGLRVVDEVARRMPEQRFIICGQGDPTPWLLCPNVEYKPPIHGRERAVLLGNATAVMCPSEYIEPFCGVNVEAQLCGTPVVSTDFGAFVETIEQGITGWRCHMLQDYVEALKLAPTLDRRYISDRARARYSLEVVGKRYDSIFKQIYDQKDKGWYSETSYL
jgi:glycosyltransferase involved in cell wall biosynthesis